MANLRRVFFTWNNWEKDFPSREDVAPYFEALPHFSGAVIGFEKGKEGTPHLQGVVQFSQQKTFATLQTYFKKNHLEKVKSLPNSITYCKKEGDYLELGVLKGVGARSDLAAFKDGILEGKSDLELLEDHTGAYMRYGSMVEKIRQLTLEEKFSREFRELKVVYLGGTTGSGKTSFVYSYFSPDEVYRVSSYGNPFDGYTGQRVLVLDEFRGQMSLSLMLNVLDRYPLRLPARYADRWAAFDTVVILSNRRLDEQYVTIQLEEPESFAAFERRIGLRLWMTDSNRDAVYAKALAYFSS